MSDDELNALIGKLTKVTTLLDTALIAAKAQRRHRVG